MTNKISSNQTFQNFQKHIKKVNWNRSKTKKTIFSIRYPTKFFNLQKRMKECNRPPETYPKLSWFNKTTIIHPFFDQYKERNTKIQIFLPWNTSKTQKHDTIDTFIFVRNLSSVSENVEESDRPFETSHA